MSEHKRADADHTPDHDPDVDQCRTCGLATTSDGRHHGDDLPTEETWLMFDDPDDEEASHAASVTGNDDGYVVSWWNEAVGLVTDVDFDTLEDAHAWLERAGYADYTA